MGGKKIDKNVCKIPFKFSSRKFNIRTARIHRMKLLTHNVLSSKGIKGVKSGYPLKIEAKDVKVCEAEFNPEFIARVITRLDWPVIVKAAKDLGHGSDLPTELPEHYETENDFLKKAHHVFDGNRHYQRRPRVSGDRSTISRFGRHPEHASQRR